MKQIQFTKGCPNNCEYCYEPKEIEQFPPFSQLQELVNVKEVQIKDMNFLANPDHLSILQQMLKNNYELICGVDYRILTQQICDLMKVKGFIKVRWAWDYSIGQQKTQKKTLEKFKKAGYKPKELSVFILVNWKISYRECLKKLKLLLSWNVKVNDCCFDGGYPKSKREYEDPTGRFEGKRFWKYEEIKAFRKECRENNHIVLFGIYPELKTNDMQPLLVYANV